MVNAEVNKYSVVRFKQIFGFVLLFSFLGFMGYKFSSNIVGGDDGLMVTLFAIIIILLIVVFVLRILQS